MNNNLIDQHILELLRTPAEQRSVNSILASMNQIAAAAQLDIAPATPMQQEQLRLIAIIEYLAQEFGAEGHHVSLEMSSSPWSTALYAVIRMNAKDNFIGWGNTAEEALKDLRSVSRDKVSA